MVPNVDDIYAGMLSSGAVIEHPLVDNPYGMRDFSIVDPDGNRYTFGTDIGEPAASAD